MTWTDKLSGDDDSPRSSYYAARRALSQHLHRHHAGATGAGTLAERLADHDDLHWQLKRRGRSAGHEHAMSDDGESLESTAHRYLQEGESHGKTDATEGS